MLTVEGLVCRYGKVAGAPQFFQGPMAKPQRMWLVIALCLWAASAPELLAFPLFGREQTIPAAILIVIILGCAVTALRRLRLIANSLRN